MMLCLSVPMPTAISETHGVGTTAIIIFRAAFSGVEARRALPSEVTAYDKNYGLLVCTYNDWHLVGSFVVIL
jgi:hypothetical protein